MIDAHMLVRSALANVVRLGSGALLILATPVLARRLAPEDFNTWSLVIQLPAIIALLEVGVTTAVTHMSASSSDPRTRSLVVSAAMRLEAKLASVGLLSVIVVVVSARLLFPAAPTNVIGDLRTGFLIVGAGAVVGLLAAPGVGLFVATGRNMSSAAVTFAIRLVAASALIMFASGPLAVLFLIVGLSQLLIVAAHLWLLNLAGTRFMQHDPVESDVIRRRLRGYVTTFGLWSLVSFLVSGLDPFVVGAFDFDHVGTYSVAVIALTIFGGLHAASSASLQSIISAAADVPGSNQLRSTLRAAYVLNGVVVSVITTAFLVAGHPLLTFWVGDELADGAYAVLCVLVLARGAAALLWPLVMGAIAAEQHQRIRITPLIEAGTNLLVSVLAAWRFGAIGAAYGTAAGVVVALVLHLAYNVPRLTAVPFERRVWAISGVIKPAVSASPLLVTLLLGPLTSPTRLLGTAVAVLLSGCLLGWQLRSGLAKVQALGGIPS